MPIDTLMTFPNRLKRAVLAGGGEFVGIQQGIYPSPDLLLFNSPTTGSTLAIPLTDAVLVTFSDSEFSTAVRAKIVESDATFADRKIWIKASTLTTLSNRLGQLKDEIDELARRK